LPSRPGRVGVGGWGPPRGQDINHQPLCTRSVLHALQAHPRRRFRAQGSSLNNPVAPFQGSRPECPILLGRPATAAQLAPLSRPCSQPRDLAPPQPPPAATSHAWCSGPRGGLRDPTNPRVWFRDGWRCLTCSVQLSHRWPTIAAGCRCYSGQRAWSVSSCATLPDRFIAHHVLIKWF